VGGFGISLEAVGDGLARTHLDSHLHRSEQLDLVLRDELGEGDEETGL
jgi:hypothetical protein